MKKIHLLILYILLSLGIILNLAPLSFAGVQNIPGEGDLRSVSAGPIS